MEILSRFKKLIAACVIVAVAIGGFWFTIIKTGFPQPTPTPQVDLYKGTPPATEDPLHVPVGKPTDLVVDTTAMAQARVFSPVRPCDVNQDGTCDKRDIAAQCSKAQLDARTCDYRAIEDIRTGIQATRTAASADGK